MHFSVLGSLEIRESGQNIVPTASKPRQVLALLLLRRGTIVSPNEIMEELWGESPPNSALTTIQTYIYQLRKILVRHGAGDLLITRPGGYSLEVDDTLLDLHRFEQAVREGRTLLETGRPVEAADRLSDALAAWRGDPLADVAQGGLLYSYTTWLQELRFRALEMRIQADLRAGRHRDLVSELQSLVLTYPLRENLHASLMIALYYSGRRSEALGKYQVLRTKMVEEFGLEPGQPLREIHQEIISDTLPGELHSLGA